MQRMTCNIKQRNYNNANYSLNELMPATEMSKVVCGQGF